MKTILELKKELDLVKKEINDIKIIEKKLIRQIGIIENRQLKGTLPLKIELPEMYENFDEYITATLDEAKEIWDEYIEENKELN